MRGEEAGREVSVPERGLGAGEAVASTWRPAEGRAEVSRWCGLGREAHLLAGMHVPTVVPDSPAHIVLRSLLDNWTEKGDL